MHYNEAKALLDKIHGATFAAMDTVTIPVLRGGKANPMQGKIAKHCNGHRVMLFTNKKSNAYLNKVVRHLQREQKVPATLLNKPVEEMNEQEKKACFSLGPLPWGERVPDSPFIQCKGRYYLQCVFLECGSIEYRAAEDISFHNGDSFVHFRKGELMLKDDIQGLNERSGSEHQGLEKEVIVRTYALDSIVSLRAFHEELV
mgnify:CR=1 FL=1